MPLPRIVPPLMNSANPWATSEKALQALFDCPHTGAITIRTSLLQGFHHDGRIHQHVFFQSQDHSLNPKTTPDCQVESAFGGSLNTLGYSPIPLRHYLEMLPRIVSNSKLPPEVRSQKPIFISVTGSSQEVKECYQVISQTQAVMSNPLCMEINLSCPNIPDKPPPAYSREGLTEYLQVLGQAKEEAAQGVAIGIKTPPYTFHGQFKEMLISLISAAQPTCSIDFITATNTLGACLVLADTDGTPALNSASGAGIGGMAGAPLHPLALGNVKTIRAMLDEYEDVKGIEIIGVGGVSDYAGFCRMKAVGASVVGVGTALGCEGIKVFEKIINGS